MRVNLQLLAAPLLLLNAASFAQQVVLAPPASLVIDAVPPVPASLVEAADRYSEYRGAQLLDWHPAARSILISTRFAETPQLHIVNMPAGDRRQLTFFKDAVRVGRFHPQGGDYIVYAKDTGGGEWFQLYRYDLARGTSTLLTDGKSRNLLGPFSSGGNLLAYTSTRRTGKDTDLWVMNPAEPASDHLLLQLQGGGWEPLDWSPDDAKILLLEVISINESHLWLVDTRSGDKTSLTPREEKRVAYGDGRFSRDGKGVYVTTDRESEFHRLAYLPLTRHEPRYLTTAIPWDVELIEASPDGAYLALVTNEGGGSALYLMATNSNVPVRVPDVPEGVIDGIRWRSDGRELAFALSNARTDGDVYSVDVAGGKPVRWTESESEVPTQDFQTAQPVTWRSFDGRTISGFLYRPPARFSGRRPVLIGIHGGPEGQARPDFLGRAGYYVNELGIAILEPNVRGSTGYGKAFTLLDNGFLREGAYKDINALLDWIATQPDLDAGRVAVAGGSYGGHMTLAVSTFYSDRIRCSVDIVGPSNLVTFLEHTEAYRRDLRRAEYGDERDPKMREFLERIAPMNHVDQIRKPMLVIAGKNDPRVPVSESDQIVAALHRQGTPVWYIMAKDEGHGFQKKPNQDYQFYATVEFLTQCLDLPKPAPAAAAAHSE
jgi:dipeptidyl aminopeptidase/acylaminoacyl peptidase